MSLFGPVSRSTRRMSRRSLRRSGAAPFRLGAERFEPRAMLAAQIVTVSAPTLPVVPTVYKVGDVIPFDVLYDEAVTLSGLPSVAQVNVTRADGSQGVAALTGFDGQVMTFEYTVQAGDVINGFDFDVMLGTDPDTGAGFLVGGIITTDSDGSPADRDADNDPAVDPTLSSMNPGITFDSILPAIQAPITATAGTYVAGQTVAITVTFSEPVTVTGGPPTLSLDTGATATLPSPTALTGITSLTFNYLVRPGDTSTALKVNAFNLNGATIADAAGNQPLVPLVSSPLTVTGPVVINAAVALSSPQLSGTAPGPALTAPPTAIQIVFNTPVRNFTLAALKLYWTPNAAGTPTRIMSLKGASLRMVGTSGTNYTLVLPKAAVSAKGAYMLVIDGSLTNLQSTINPAAGLSTPQKLYFRRV